MGVRILPGALFYKNMTKKRQSKNNRFNPKVALVSLGCSKNTVDSEQLMGELYRAQFDLVGEPEEADAVIVNTCGFIEPAAEESRSTILEMIKVKDDSVLKKVYAMGCFVSKNTEDWSQGYGGLDGVFSLKESNQIVETLQKDFEFYKKLDLEDYYVRPVATTLPHYSYLKIAEGCNRTCTYCTIPSIRGGNVSKKIEDLIFEAKALAKRGAKEIILIAQDTTAYGIDLYGEPRLLSLLKELIKIKEISWFRLFYAYPDYIDDELAEFLANEPKMIPYLDLPIQHSHSGVLKRMGRKNTFDRFDALFKKLRVHNEDFCLRTTVITGFPGETFEEHEHLKKYIQEISFDRLGVFKYIREKTTPAHQLGGHHMEDEKSRRYDELMLIQQQNHFRKNKSLVGKKLATIIDGGTKDPNIYIGRTFRDAPDIDANVFVQSKKKLYSGLILDVEITDVADYDLVANV